MSRRLDGPGDGPRPAGGSAPVSWRVVQGAILVLAAGFFLFGLRSVLNPFLLYWVLVALLVPFRGLPGHAWMLTVATAAAVFWVLATAGSLLAPFFLAFVLAYILDPVVDRVQAIAPRVGRTGAIVLVAVPFALAGAGVATLGVPAFARQAAALAAEAPRVLATVSSWIGAVDPSNPGFDLPLVDEEALLARIRRLDAQTISAFLQERLAVLAQGAWTAVLGLGRGLATLVTVAGYVVLTPVLAFYLLRDYDRIVARAAALLPARVRPEAAGFFREYDGLLSRYLRGQVSVALVVGGITWLGLLVVGFPYSFLLGALVAVLGVVPYLGVILSLVPAVIIALASADPGTSLIKVGVVYGVAQALEGAVVSPRIVGDSVGLHPVWILLSLSLGGFVFGFAGLLIGVPLAVGVKLLLGRGVERYKASDLYRGRV